MLSIFNFNKNKLYLNGFYVAIMSLAHYPKKMLILMGVAPKDIFFIQLNPSNEDSKVGLKINKK